MRVAGKTTILPDSSKMYTKKQLGRHMKEKETLQNKIFRLYPQYSLQYLLQSAGFVYHTEKDTVTGINNQYKQWILKTNMYNVVTFVDSSLDGTETDYGLGGVPITFCTNIKWYDPYDIIRLENGQQLRILNIPPEPLDTRKTRYHAVLHGVGNDKSIDTRYMMDGRTSNLVHDAHGEASIRGYMKKTSNGEMHREWLHTGRVSYSISGHAASTLYVIEDEAGNEKETYFLPKGEKEALDFIAWKKEMYLIYGETNVDATSDGTPRFWGFDDKQSEIIVGNGIINQISPARRRTYGGEFKESMMKDAVTEMLLSSGRDSKNGCTIDLITGIHGYNAFQETMRGLLTVGSNVYETRDGNEITLGGNFSTWIYGKSKIRVSVNSVFDDPSIASELDSQGRRKESFRMLFLDTSEYEGEKNISLFTRPGRALVKGELDGIGGQNGRTSGKIATSTDASETHYLYEIGAQMINPHSSVMFEKY